MSAARALTSKQEKPYGKPWINGFAAPGAFDSLIDFNLVVRDPSDAKRCAATTIAAFTECFKKAP